MYMWAHSMEVWISYEVQKMSRLSPSALVQGPSIFFVIMHWLNPIFLCSHLLPSELSPYPLINQVIHFIPGSWIMNFFPNLFCNKTRIFFFFFFFLAERQNSVCIESIYCRLHPNSSQVMEKGVRVVWGYKVRSTHPISFVCSVSFSGRHISSPRQRGNKREAAGEIEEVGEGGPGRSDQKHSVLNSTWSCFIISWSSSDTSCDGVFGSGGNVCVCVCACV